MNNNTYVLLHLELSHLFGLHNIAARNTVLCCVPYLCFINNEQYIYDHEVFLQQLVDFYDRSLQSYVIYSPVRRTVVQVAVKL